MSIDEKEVAAQSLLLSPEIFANPYPIYRQLRSFDPVHWEPSFNSWIITGYADVLAVLRDPRFGAERTPNIDQLTEWGIPETYPLFNMVGKMMLMQDPPNHTRLRGLVNKAFTPRVVEGMRSRIQQIVDELLGKVESMGRMDIIRDLAVPLPTMVIAIMLGVPHEDRNQLKKWSSDFALFIGAFSVSTDELGRIQQSMGEFTDYFRGCVAEARKNPKDDLLSAMAHAEEQGDMLSEEELLANCVLLLAAGHETTTNLIGNGMLALLRNPDQKEKLQADPSLIVSAVEELLRYDSPVQLTGRVTKEEIEFSGKRIGKGQEIMVVMGAANRDPERFPDPDRLDITRQDNRHLSFGQGPHFCLGAPLARLEGQIAISTLLRRMPGLRLETEELEWQQIQVLHGLKALPVLF